MAGQHLATRILILLTLKLIWPIRSRAIKELQTQEDMFQYGRFVSGANYAPKNISEDTCFETTRWHYISFMLELCMGKMKKLDPGYILGSDKCHGTYICWPSYFFNRHYAIGGNTLCGQGIQNATDKV
jgi:hypothetical protein